MPNYQQTTVATIGGWCQHGERPCGGNPDSGLAPCAGSDHHYCPHGWDARRQTTDHEPRCPTCRGITRPQRNRDTYRPARRPARP